MDGFEGENFINYVGLEAGRTKTGPAAAYAQNFVTGIQQTEKNCHQTLPTYTPPIKVQLLPRGESVTCPPDSS